MASGQGKRFGGSKLLADFRGKPLIGFILDLTGDGLFACRLVVTRHRETAELCREKGIPVLVHDLPDRSDTVRLGLEKLLETFPLKGCMFCPADQPLIRRESLEAMVSVFSRFPEEICRLGYGIAGGQGENCLRAGSPVLFGKRYFPELLQLPRGRGGSYLAEKYPGQVRIVPAREEYELMDVDTSEDLLNLLVLGEQNVQKDGHHCSGNDS